MSEVKTVRVKSASIRGLEAEPIVLEVTVERPGLPSLNLVGFTSGNDCETRSRVRCALRSSGFNVPRAAVTVSASPCDVRRSGREGLDLAVAAGVLAASGQVPCDWLEDTVVYGALELDGEVLPARGTVAVQDAVSDGDRLLTSDLAEVSDLGSAVLGVHSLSDLRQLDHVATLKPREAVPASDIDMSDVPGGWAAKRAMAIAVAGGHGISLAGADAEALAMRATTIMPAMSDAERDECARIASVCGDSIDRALAGERPCRRARPYISASTLLGGGRPVRPGEVTRAHNGALILDGIQNFFRTELNMLAVSLRDETVRLVRADGGYVFPARAFVVGVVDSPRIHLDEDDRPRLSNSDEAVPLHAHAKDACIGSVTPIRVRLGSDVGGCTQSSDLLRSEVEAARDFAASRHGKQGGISASAMRVFAECAQMYPDGLSTVCGVARTIADMEGQFEIREEHALEAVMLTTTLLL